MADEVILRDGQFMRRDQRSGRFVPATEQELDVIQAGARGVATSFVEGAIPITGILEQLGAVEEGFANALRTVNPGASLGGEAAGTALLLTAAPAALSLARTGFQMVRGVTGGVSRTSQTAGRIRATAQAADEGPIPVPRDLGEFVPGGPTGVVSGAVGGAKSILQGVVEQSKVLTRVAQAIPGGARLTPNVGRQIASNLAGIRGTGLRAADFGANGKLSRQALGKAKKATDKLYDDALPAAARNEVVDIAASQKALLDAIKTAPKSERALIRQILSKEQIEAGKMTNQQLLQRHKELRALSSKTDNQLTRDAIDKVTSELERLMLKSKGINTSKLAAGNEQWRFDQMMNNALEESGQLNYSKLISQAKKFFPREFGRGDVAGLSHRGIHLSQKGMDAINTLIDIEAAGGVSLPSKAISAIDWATGLGLIVGSTSSGVF